jgi:hypothetical protein
MNKPYKEGTPLTSIIKDSWSRGFKVSQTVDELTVMGYTMNAASVIEAWKILDCEMKAFINSEAS